MGKNAAWTPRPSIIQTASDGRGVHPIVFNGLVRLEFSGATVMALHGRASVIAKTRPCKAMTEAHISITSGALQSNDVSDSISKCVPPRTIWQSNGRPEPKTQAARRNQASADIAAQVPAVSSEMFEHVIRREAQTCHVGRTTNKPVASSPTRKTEAIVNLGEPGCVSTRTLRWGSPGADASQLTSNSERHGV